MAVNHDSEQGLNPSRAVRFHSTQWSQVLRAASPEDPGGQPALAELCRAYWYPLYAYVRRRGQSHSQAEDAVQTFFAWLLEKNILRYADPDRGRFRGFLVAAMSQFLARQYEYATAAKRCPPGGLISFDAMDADTRYRREPADNGDPDHVFDYTWAVAVVTRAMDRLRAEQEAAGRRERFDAFHGLLTGQAECSAAELARQLGLAEGAVRVALHRFRQRYAELLRNEVAATLDDGESVDDELRYLLNVLKSGRRV